MLAYPIPFPFPCWQGKGWPAIATAQAGVRVHGTLKINQMNKKSLCITRL